MADYFIAYGPYVQSTKKGANLCSTMASKGRSSAVKDSLLTMRVGVRIPPPSELTNTLSHRNELSIGPTQTSLDRSGPPR